MDLAHPKRTIQKQDRLYFNIAQTYNHGRNCSKSIPTASGHTLVRLKLKLTTHKDGNKIRKQNNKQIDK